MIPQELLNGVGPVAEGLQDLGVSYVITGSVAALAYGMYRSTADVDIVVDLRHEHVAPLVARLEDAYYIDADMLYDAIQHRSSCNLIYLESMLKIDLFIPRDEQFEASIFRRARAEEYETSKGEYQFSFTSPEDLVLRKLEWYRNTNLTSERQWTDILGVLKVQARALDFVYMHVWAQRLGISELLGQALEDAGLPQSESGRQ
ncbi:MAG TPA: hypothetical protein VF952_00330 [Chloroflexia bacterium]|jgi:hypothetical protein